MEKIDLPIEKLSHPFIKRVSALPAPTLLVVILLLWAFSPLQSFESFRLMSANTLVGYTIFNIAAAALIARSFIELKRPSLLMMGCGVVIWSCSGLTITLYGLKQPQGAININHMITAHNCCIWVSSFCHLAGASLSVDWQASPKRPLSIVAIAYGLSVATACVIITASSCGWLPTFFTPGEGGTLVRHFVLSSAAGMLFLTGFILLYLNRSASPYLHWYPHALILLALGIMAILLQKANGSWIGWIGRGTQSLGGFYMLIAAVLSTEKPVTEGIALWQALNEMRQKWVLSTAIAAAVASLGAATRLLFLPFLGYDFPFATFYPAVFVAAAYGGLGPGLAATGLSVVLVHWVHLATVGAFEGHAFLILRSAIFTLVGISLSTAWNGIHKLQKRASLAEAEAAFASERALAAEMLRETSSKLQQSEQSFSAFVKTANEGVWVVEFDGTTSYINKRLAQILDRDESEVLGREAQEFIYSEDLPLFRQQLEILRRGEVSTYELRIPRRDGSLTWLHVSSAPLFNGDNGVHGSFAMCTEITKLKETEEKLLQLNLHLEQKVLERSAELRRLNHELESFCYSLSHELRAPIARLEAFSSLVKEAVEDGNLDELPHLSQRIEIGSKRMRVVIDSLLMINRLSRTEVQKDQVNLSELARVITAELCDEAPGQQVLLLVEPNVIVAGDRAMLNICLRNLLENAFKYSRKKDVVSVEFGVDGDSGAFFIRDAGIGFDMNFSHHLFEPFSRLHQEKEFEGSGMGLSIVKRIVERHGGRVWAEGRPGEGATFFFTLEDERCADWYGLTGGVNEQPVAVAC